MSYVPASHAKGFFLITLLLVFCGLSGVANTAHAQVRAYVTNTDCERSPSLTP